MRLLVRHRFKRRRMATTSYVKEQARERSTMVTVTRLDGNTTTKIHIILWPARFFRQTSASLMGFHRPEGAELKWGACNLLADSNF